MDARGWCSYVCSPPPAIPYLASVELTKCPAHGGRGRGISRENSVSRRYPKPSACKCLLLIPNIYAPSALNAQARTSLARRRLRIRRCRRRFPAAAVIRSQMTSSDKLIIQISGSPPLPPHRRCDPGEPESMNNFIIPREQISYGERNVDSASDKEKRSNLASIRSVLFGMLGEISPTWNHDALKDGLSPCPSGPPVTSLKRILETTRNVSV